MTETFEPHQIRNVAIIAHVDHGKTTLVDQLLYQSGMFRRAELDKLAGGQHNLIFDSDPLERERGITILSKNCAVHFRGEDGISYKINLIDTPGHADFGGEVERVLSMADGALLLVDAFEGPMPQTRFVLQKALNYGLRPIVVINKVDRGDARPDAVVTEVFDLLVELEADDEALDFPVIYASGRDGWATLDLDDRPEHLLAVFRSIIDHVPAPTVNREAPLQLRVTSLDYSDYVGRIAIGRVHGGSISRAEEVAVFDREGRLTRQRVLQVLEFEALGRREVQTVAAGDICAVTGLDPIDIGNTIASAEAPEPLPLIAVDRPTLHMIFRVNDGPFAGKEGEFVTSRQLGERLERELRSDVALRVEPGVTADEFLVSGRGLMHLGILLEKMRREGYEVCAGNPRVIYREIDGRVHEPIELLSVDCPVDCQSAILRLLGDRRSEMLKMEGKPGASGYVHMEFSIPARGLIGLRGRVLNATQGKAIVHHTFLAYEPKRGSIPQRQAGVMIANDPGQVTAYALDSLYDRGTFFVRPGDPVYEGQLVGEHCKDQDITVNAVRAKALTNIRAAGKDDATRVRPPRELSLEAALEYIHEDELVEITPQSLRLRKRILREADRRRAARRAKV